MKFIFAWYDFWVGWYWDRENRRLYILPFPMIGMMIQFKPYDPCKVKENDNAND